MSAWRSPSKSPLPTICQLEERPCWIVGADVARPPSIVQIATSPHVVFRQRMLVLPVQPQRVPFTLQLLCAVEGHTGCLIQLRNGAVATATLTEGSPSQSL